MSKNVYEHFNYLFSNTNKLGDKYSVYLIIDEWSIYIGIQKNNEPHIDGKGIYEPIWWDKKIKKITYKDKIKSYIDEYINKMDRYIEMDNKGYDNKKKNEELVKEIMKGY